MMEAVPSPPETSMLQVDDLIFQAINSSQSPSSPSVKSPSIDHSLSHSSANASASSSSSPPSSFGQGRPRRKPIPRKGHTKSRRGCFSCKRRRVKCQEKIPSCDNCYRLGLRCEYPQSQDSDLMTLPASRPAQPISQSQLSMTDLHFFHHFLLHAYPGLPIRGEGVWREVAQYSHGVST